MTLLSERPHPPTGVLHFPDEGSEAWQLWHAHFSAGRIPVGIADDGTSVHIDLHKAAHTLIGGDSGAGKSALLTLPVYGALMNPSQTELVVLDSSEHEFSWVNNGSHPNVTVFSGGAHPIFDMYRGVQYVIKSVRQRLKACVNISPATSSLAQLRRMCEATGFDPLRMPKRLILVIDDLSTWLTPEDDPQLRRLQDQARAWLAEILQSDRAAEVNVFAAAHRPTTDAIGATVRMHMENRIGIGPMTPFASFLIVGSWRMVSADAPATPQGQAMVTAPGHHARTMQTLLLPSHDDLPGVTSARTRLTSRKPVL